MPIKYIAHIYPNVGPIISSGTSLSKGSFSGKIGAYAIIKTSVCTKDANQREVKKSIKYAVIPKFLFFYSSVIN